MTPVDVPQSASRRSRRWITALMLGAAALASHASDFYRLTILRETGVTLGPDWVVGPQGIGINDDGVVTYHAGRIVNGLAEGGIFVSTSATPIATAPNIAGVNNPSINNLGEVAYTLAGSPSLVLVRDQTGGIGTLLSCGGPTALLCNTTTISNNTRSATRANTNPSILQIFGLNGAVVTSASLPTDTLLVYGDPVISRDGRNAALAFTLRPTGNSSPTFVIGSLNQSAFAMLPIGSGYNVRGVSTNDHGITAFLSDGTVPYVGAISRSVGSSLIRVADTTGGSFETFGVAGNGGVSLNNLNEVAFVGRRVVNNANTIDVFVGNVSGRDPPRPAVTRGEPIDGGTFAGVTQNGFEAQSMNNKGQIAFYATILRGTTSRAVILRADPVEGVSPGNPIMPSAGSPLPSGWRFMLTCQQTPALCARGVRRFIDPALAVGYTYQVEAPGPNFESVYIAAPLPNGDDSFQVEFNGQVAALRAGEVFDFTGVVPGGVSTFRITGIDPTEALDPADATAFVTGLTFVSDSLTDYSVTMVPIVVDPDDVDRDGVPNTADLCPDTAPGASVDSNGCSADQRDSDSDGVVDSGDLCPATPIGSPVDANGCSASQLDADGDGVPNSTDACPGTAPGAAVDSRGCSAAQRDTDGDGVNDSLDLCPNTPAGAAVNSSGCVASQLDSDGDGVTDNLDVCPGTAPGTAVDASGCPLPPPPIKSCDVNGDTFIDYRDIGMILVALGQPAKGTSDPRDANRNGKIDLNDAAICTKKCDRRYCLPAK